MQNMQDQDDKALIIEAQHGNDRAFEKLLRLYYDRIFAMAYSWCRNGDLAQDITQATCIAIVKNIRSYKHDAAFLTWTYRIVVNTAKNMNLSTKRRMHYESEYVQDNADSHEPSSHEALEQRQLFDLVHSLPDIFKQPLLLVHFQGLNHKQAAQVLGCAEMTVSWRIHKARKLLAEKTQ
jgi:RNA polymerase sigma-70 factor (ECF subfamily)